ncbi:MAG: SDR family oxidoreductase [Dermatophilaceae bacterium]
MLSGKRLLISGVATGDGIAAAVAERALLAGAEVLVAAFPRDVAAAEAVVATFSRPAAVVAVDATSEDDLVALEEDVRHQWGHLDGALHAIAFAPQAALGGVMDVPATDVEMAVRTRVWTYAAFGRLLRRLAPSSGASLVGLDFDSSGAWPVYNWMGPCKAPLRSLNDYLARDLGAMGVRANLVAAGPLRTQVASGIPDFEVLMDRWGRQAALAWDPMDASGVADAVCFLLSDLARAITGEVLHVDGGFHAMATCLNQPSD